MVLEWSMGVLEVDEAYIVCLKIVAELPKIIKNIFKVDLRGKEGLSKIVFWLKTVF